MSIIKRAWLYVTRKHGKTLLLTIILLVIATFVLTALSIRRAADQAHEAVLEAMGGKFTVGIGNAKNNPYNVQEEAGENSYYIINTGPRLTPANIEEIMSLGDIKKYHANQPTNATVPELELVKGTLPSSKGLEHFLRGYAVTGSDTSDYFISKTLTLIQGRHITQGDTGVVLISDAFAEQNNLKLGDTINFEIDDETARLVGVKPGVKTPVKIIGIFAKTESYDSDPSSMSQPINLIENLYFTDMSTNAEMYHEANEFYQAKFYARDPGQIQQTVEKVRALDSLDWKQFEVVVDTEAYNNTIKPIEGLRSTISMMLLISVIVSALILSLVLAMWLKSRIHEAGIYLSIGISKIAIFSQFLIEALLIAVVAFSLSFLLGSFAVPQAGSAFIDYNVEMQNNQNESGEDNGAAAGKSAVVGETGEEEISTIEPVETLQVTVQPIDFIQTCLIGLLVIGLSVLIASAPILRLSPRKILSLMS